MTAYKEKTLDTTAAKIKPVIYEVDGLRGTLKELSDYFQVDPVEVSDLLLTGVSMEDALCKASSVKVAGVKKKPVVKKAAGKEKMKIHYKKIGVKDLVNRNKKDPEITVKEEKSSVDKKAPVIKKSVKVSKKAESNLVAGKAVTENVVPLVTSQVSNQLTSSIVTDVKDMGDLIIVTTTTTTVYRKDV